MARWVIAGGPHVVCGIRPTGEPTPPRGGGGGEHAPQLDRFAASELCGYLEKLFQIHVQPATRVPGPVDAVFLIGNPQTNPEVKLATARQPFPPVSDQESFCDARSMTNFPR